MLCSYKVEDRGLIIYSISSISKNIIRNFLIFISSLLVLANDDCVVGKWWRARALFIQVQYMRRVVVTQFDPRWVILSSIAIHLFQNIGDVIIYDGIVL